MEFDSNLRLMLVAPHPDDEALGCGVVLQRAVQAGASVRVVYATNGDNNPWPQRWSERKWRLEGFDRHRWGEIRRGEALAALSVLGVPPSAVRFMGLADQGLTDLLVTDCQSVTHRFLAKIREWAPTHLVIPSVYDTHPDHNALGTILRLALSEYGDAGKISVHSYAVHGCSPGFFDRAETISPTTEEKAVKFLAIQCHRTQLHLSRRRFLAFANRPERLGALEREHAPRKGGAVSSISRDEDRLQLSLRFSFRPFSALKPRLLVCGNDLTGAPRSLSVQLPLQSGIMNLRDASNGQEAGVAEYSGSAFGGEVQVPCRIFSGKQPLFVKIDRRNLGFFDEAGWLEAPASASQKPDAVSSCPSEGSAVARQDHSVESGRRSVMAPASWLSRRWVLLFGLLVLWLGAMLSGGIDRPWINLVDYNGAVWSQSAHNILRAGLTQTAGASSGFYFGPLPIPSWGYYLHHPPLLHLLIAALFAAFGEHEWVARLVPVGCSLATLILLWLLVRSCLGVRTATLSAAVFACLPMELRYGQMVNFEPCILLLIMGSLLCLRYWSVSGRSLWKYGAASLILVGLWVDWAMHIFVVVLCLSRLLQSRKERRFAWALFLATLLSVVVYLLRIQFLRPDAWQNLSHAFVVRLGSGGHDHFSEMQWVRKIFHSLAIHFLPLGWMLATAGSLVVFRGRCDHKGLRWLAWACVCIAAMDAIFVGVFQNDSYIHQYIAFYFVAPVAILAGIALDWLVGCFQRIFARHALALSGELAAGALVLILAVNGTAQAGALRRQFRILDYATAEPENLIPQLGEAIQKGFPPGTEVLCNFLPDYGPQFGYYAQRDILNNLSEYRFWQRYLQDPKKLVGGVVWMKPKASRDLIAKLPPGNRKFLTFGNFSFCLWQPSPLATQQSLKGSVGNKIVGSAR